jgi:hypothetical protein
MNKFEIVFDGVTYVVQGPDGSTADQARAVFDQQLATGSLTVLESGQVLDSTTQASQGLASAVSQIEFANLQKSLQQTTIQTNLSEISVEKPINTANFIKQGATNTSVGQLTTSVVQGLMSQTAKNVNQPSAEISNALGLGKFGLNAQQLESQGFIKPAVAAMVNKTNDLVSTLSSPTVWTGKMGIQSIEDVLENEKMQNSIQESLMTSAQQQLEKNGTIQNLINEKEVAAVINTAAKYGTNTAVNLIKGQLGGDSAAVISGFAKSSEFSAAFGKIAESPNNVNSVISGLTGNVSKTAEQLNSNLTKNISSGVNDLVGGVSGKLLGTVSGLSSGLVNKLTGSLGGGIVGGVAGQLTGQVANRLIGQAATQLQGGIGQITGGITSGLGSITGAVTGKLGEITSSISGSISGAFNNITSGFANPGQLANLDLGDINNVTGAIGNTGVLSSIGGQLSSVFSGISSEVSKLGGALNNFGGISIIGAFAGLGGGNALQAGVKQAKAVYNTVNRKSLDASFKNIVGDDKVPGPEYTNF